MKGKTSVSWVPVTRGNVDRMSKTTRRLAARISFLFSLSILFHPIPYSSHSSRSLFVSRFHQVALVLVYSDCGWSTWNSSLSNNFFPFSSMRSLVYESRGMLTPTMTMIIFLLVFASHLFSRDVLEKEKEKKELSTYCVIFTIVIVVMNLPTLLFSSILHFLPLSSAFSLGREDDTQNAAVSIAV